MISHAACRIETNATFKTEPSFWSIFVILDCSGQSGDLKAHSFASKFGELSTGIYFLKRVSSIDCERMVDNHVWGSICGRKRNEI